MDPPRPGAGGFLIPPDSEPGKYELGSVLHSPHDSRFSVTLTAADSSFLFLSMHSPSDWYQNSYNNSLYL